MEYRYRVVPSKSNLAPDSRETLGQVTRRSGGLKGQPDGDTDTPTNGVAVRVQLSGAAEGLGGPCLPRGTQHREVVVPEGVYGSVDRGPDGRTGGRPPAPEPVISRCEPYEHVTSVCIPRAVVRRCSRDEGAENGSISGNSGGFGE